MNHMPSSDEHQSIYLLYRVGRLLRHRSAELMNRLDAPLSPEQWGIIRQLTVRGPLHLRDLTDPHLDDRPNITRLVDSLVRQGLVERTPGQNDRRRKVVRLTAKGEALEARILTALNEAKARIFEDIDPDDTARLLRTLLQLEENLTKERSHDD